ncbi:DNA-directed RNA polymerase subunit delta [Mycoplasmopsis adleri]|uniref:DNA-directed RNA polymerase subunit delta n=1 Tax=Mycoplasmopsis adleri TaxID=51362 RepID=UPI0038738368
MSTMLDLTIEYTLKNCANNKYVEFNKIFDAVEAQLKYKWEQEAREKNVPYDKIRLNKVGELYRLLTVDSRFERNAAGLWTTREGFE